MLSKGSGKERLANIALSCGRCGKIIPVGSHYIWWNRKVSQAKYKPTPCHVHCWKEIPSVCGKCPRPIRQGEEYIVMYKKTYLNDGTVFRIWHFLVHKECYDKINR